MSYPHPTTLLMAAALVLGANAAKAGGSGDFRQVAVSFQTFELQTDGGFQTVVKRLQQAAKRVCTNNMGLTDFIDRDCEDGAMKDAMFELLQKRVSVSDGGLTRTTSR